MKDELVDIGILVLNFSVMKNGYRYQRICEVFVN